MTDLNRHEMLAMVAQMEGWVTGLQLVSLALRSQGNVQEYLALPDKSITYFKTYLLEDVLEHESAHVQTFLLQIAILRTLNIELCNVVTGQDNAATMLAYLVKKNLFITAVPGQSGWYRLHQVFADILEDQLLIRLPDQVNDLHLRAARWYKAAGITEYAVRHLLAAQAWEEAAALIENHAPSIFMPRRGGQTITLVGRATAAYPAKSPVTDVDLCPYAPSRSNIQRDSYPVSNDAMAMDEGQLADYLAGLEQGLL